MLPVGNIPENPPRRRRRIELEIQVHSVLPAASLKAAPQHTDCFCWNAWPTCVGGAGEAAARSFAAMIQRTGWHSICRAGPERATYPPRRGKLVCRVGGPNIRLA